MTPLRALAVVALAAVCAAALAAGTRVPFAPEPGETAALRFAWRADHEPVQHCRTPSAEELARLPVHMRRREICERRLPTSRLAVAVDGEMRLDVAVEPVGAERDRPAVVLREIRIAPGTHRVRVEFSAEGGAGPPRRLAADVTLAPREVVLVTTEASAQPLVLRRAGRTPGPGGRDAR